MATKVRYKSNAPVVIKKTQDAAEVIGKRMGAYIMGTARRSLPRKLKSGEPSAPGEKPRAGSVFKKNILFAYDPRTRSTVIGPRLLPGKAYVDTAEALERGKSTTRYVPVGGKGKGTKKVAARYAARPFMVPALEQRIGELPGLWKNAIRN
jgi:hypothetical protein